MTLSAPETISVPAHGRRSFRLTLSIDSARLRNWTMNSGPDGANGDLLSVFEYDGYLKLTDAGGATANNLSLPWHVLPRLAGNVVASPGAQVNQPVTVTNRGVGEAAISVYSLLGSSPVQAQPGAGSNAEIIDLRYVGYATYAVPAGFCSERPGYVLEFAINNARRQSHANAPGYLSVQLDTDRDGRFDFEVFTFDAALNFSDGRNATWVANLRTGEASAFFFTGHGLESATYQMVICDVQLADPARPASLGGPLAPPRPGQPVNARIEAVDGYFTGEVTDAIEGLTFAPGGERYLATLAPGGAGFAALPGGASAELTITDTGSTTNPTETGLLLVTGNAPEPREVRVISVRE